MSLNLHNALTIHNKELDTGQRQEIISPNYPNNYRPLQICRWQISGPSDSQFHLDCNIHIPTTPDCSGDFMAISKTGDASLLGAVKYCNISVMEMNSVDNALTIGLSSSATSEGGYFNCTVTSLTSALNKISHGGCGWKKTLKIVGGQETGINEFPMMAGLVDSSLRTIYCGSTIISARYVLTAAHCLQNSQVANVAVLCGDHNIKIAAETSAKLIKAIQFIKHPSYTGNGYDYDIGLVRTASDIIFSDRIGPACLPFSFASENFVNMFVDALGWGTTVFAGADSDVLRKVQLQVITQDSCASSLGSVVNDKILCTFTKGKDACQHDSGGPLLFQSRSNGRVYIVGVIIGGYGCATNRPGLNTKVTKYLQWISDNAVGASFCEV